MVARPKGIRAIYAVGGGSIFALNSRGGVPVENIGRVVMELKNYRERRPGEEIMNEIRRNTAHIPGVHVEVREPQSGPSGGKDVMIVLSDADIDAASSAAASTWARRSRSSASATRARRW